MLKVRSNVKLPEGIETPEEFIHKCLTDLFFLCTCVLRKGKKVEYRDLNNIHMQLCDWMDFVKNPILQKLILMSRDTLKSTIGRALIIQQILNLAYHDSEGLIGIVTGKDDLATEHLQIITRELLNNELLQTYFHGIIPSKKTDADSWEKDKIRYKKFGIDIGSIKRSLTGRHYLGIWNDNFMNEINSATPDYRRKCVSIWQYHESLLAENAWEIVSETPWERDDLSGIILDPDGKFDYKKIHKKSPAIFISSTGYAVFACGAVNEKDEPNFPEKGITKRYLARKRKKMGSMKYRRMYELLPISSEEKVFSRKWIHHYESLPYNYIRNIGVDCAGTKKKDSSFSAVSVADWDETEELSISYAHKRKLSPLELFKWVCEVWDNCIQIGRPATLLLVEREKYGIFLADLVEGMRPDIYVMTVNLKNRPRNTRMLSMQPYYEHGRVKSKKGLTDYEEEVDEYHLDKKVGVDILDSIFLQFEGKMIPNKMPEVPDYDDEVDGFSKQLNADLNAGNQSIQQIASRF